MLRRTRELASIDSPSRSWFSPGFDTADGTDAASASLWAVAKARLTVLLEDIVALSTSLLPFVWDASENKLVASSFPSLADKTGVE